MPPSLPPRDRSPIAAAMEWVSRILAAVVVMIGPGLLGYWLDERWGSKYLAAVGFGVGLALGLLYLVMIAKSFGPKARRSPRNRTDGSD